MSTDATSPPYFDALSSGELPEEFFLEGPVPDGDDLLARTVARVHRHSARTARVRVATAVAAVLVVGATVTGAGMALGHWMSDQTVAAVTISDMRAGARMRAVLTPADGGTHVVMTVTGLPVGTRCRLTITDKAGDVVHNGSWQVGPDGGAKPITTTAWVPPDQIANVQVDTSDGVDMIGSAG